MTVDYTDFDEVAHQDKLHFFYDAQSRPVKVEFNGTVYTYLPNLQGDIVGILDNAGTLVVEYKYDAWGKPLNTTGTLADTLGKRNPFRYRGYVFDEETGFYFLSNRQYNSTNGRFINEDTTDVLSLPYFQAGQYNLFAYCLNNPASDMDDDGQLSWLAKVAIGAAAIAVGVVATVATGGAALPALVAGAKAACVAGAISAGTSAVVTAVDSSLSGDDASTVARKSLHAAVGGFADGFMMGGIVAGGSQIISSIFKVAANLGVPTGRKGGLKIGNFKFFSPDASWQPNNGGTLLKIGKTFRIDVGSATLLHVHIPGIKAHIPLGNIIAGAVAGIVNAVKKLFGDK